MCIICSDSESCLCHHQMKTTAACETRAGCMHRLPPSCYRLRFAPRGLAAGGFSCGGNSCPHAVICFIFYSQGGRGNIERRAFRCIGTASLRGEQESRRTHILLIFRTEKTVRKIALFENSFTIKKEGRRHEGEIIAFGVVGYVSFFWNYSTSGQTRQCSNLRQHIA